MRTDNDEDDGSSENPMDHCVQLMKTLQKMVKRMILSANDGRF